MSLRPVDFLVIGGAPAGCAFATLAARAGASVVLVERDDYQRFRPGEHLAGRVRPLLDALGVPAHGTDAIVTRSGGIRSIWDDGAPLMKFYGATGQATALSVVRQEFDALLVRTAREAGAAFVRARPAQIERSRATWAVGLADHGGRGQRVQAHSIVDATGRRACVARRQGARRVHHGDLVAIVRCLDIPEPQRLDALLTVESCSYGWWSLSIVGGRTAIATFYTSLAMMRASRATADAWWTQALAGTRHIRRSVEHLPAGWSRPRVYPACPSRSSLVVGDGWIAIGDAAIALDPLAGQGVAFAIETAFRAFEAARVDATWHVLGAEYRDALISRFERHLEGRANVYDEAANVLPEAFFRSAVMPERLRVIQPHAVTPV